MISSPSAVIADRGRLAVSERGWFRCHRGEQGLELLKASPHAFALLYVIAHRARWHDGFNQHGLALGQAFVGDFENYGMSERNYRTAKEQLSKWGFATFKPTNKGTVATLVSTVIFDASTFPADGQADRPPTDDRRTGDGRVTTNKQGNKDTREQGRGDAPARGAFAEVPDLKQAEAMVMADAIPADFIALAHADWMDNGGCNAKGTPKPWPGYVRTRWRYEAGEWKAGTHRGQQRNGKPTVAATHRPDSWA